MSQSIPTRYISRGLAQKNCPGGSGFDFRKLPRAGNSTRAGITWKMKLKLQKIAWIKLLQVKRQQQKETSRILDLFRGLRVFSMEFFLGYGSMFCFYCYTYLTKKSEKLSLACLFEVFTGLWLSTPILSVYWFYW